MAGMRRKCKQFVNNQRIILQPAEGIAFKVQLFRCEIGQRETFANVKASVRDHIVIHTAVEGDIFGFLLCKDGRADVRNLCILFFVFGQNRTQHTFQIFTREIK